MKSETDHILEILDVVPHRIMLICQEANIRPDTVRARKLLSLAIIRRDQVYRMVRLLPDCVTGHRVSSITDAAFTTNMDLW